MYDLTDFIDAAVALAESIEDDIRKGEKYSSESVLKLSKFVAVAQPALIAMAAVIKDKTQLQ